MKKVTMRQITDNALVAAVYVAVTTLTASFSFLNIQFRIAEILVLLCFFRKDFIFGVVIGTFLANLQSPMGFYDVLFGTLASLLSCLAIGFSKHLFIATLYPVIINGLVVGAELHFLLAYPFWLNAGLVALGEFAVVSVLGFSLFAILRRNRRFLEEIKATQNNA
ncbi:MAG: QueT transporter family protein [Firmicutes bacterium]|nr:QueT transporter family protein [Bacillota bacterium]